MNTNPSTSLLVRWLREPLLQFLLIGAGIYGLYALVSEPEQDPGEATVVVDASRIAAFVSGWQARMNRPPTKGELDAAIEQYIKEEILYREAIAMGLGEDDPITRRRLAQKLEFLTRDVARLREPDEGELEDWYEAHKADYRPPELVTFTHEFVDPDLRQEGTLAQAQSLLKQLEQMGEPDSNSPRLGDRFVLQYYYPQKSAAEIQKMFGRGFTDQLMQLAPNQWHGPVLSGYGAHLVYVHAFLRPDYPAFGEVRDQVFEDWQAVQQDTFNEQYLDGLKSRYDIVIDESAVSASVLSGQNAAPAAADGVLPNS